MQWLRRAAALTLVLVVCACTRQTANVNHRANTLIIAQQREPRSLNPALENGTSSMQWGELLFSYLVKFDDQGRLIGDAALQAPTLANGGISADGLTVTYHLRTNLRFSDGTPLTAADGVATVAAIMNPSNNVQSRYGYDQIAKAEAPNDRTLVLHLKRPFAPLVALVFAPQGFPILPKHVLDKYPDFNAIPFDEKPIGSGPYRVVKWQHGDSVTLEPNPYYYGGKPKIARIVVRFVPDSTTAMDQLRTGEIDAFFNDENRGDYPLLQSLHGYKTIATPMDAVGAIIFNTQSEPTNDPRVRHAIAHAIDVRSLIAKTYRGSIDSNAAGRGLFMWAYNPKAYPDATYDPARANQLLDEAGWKRGPNGLRTKSGQPLSLHFIVQAGTPGDAQIGSEVIEYGRAIGADVTIKQYEATQFVAPAGAGGPVYGGNFNIALYPFLNGDDPDTSDQFECKNVPPNGYNKSRICDPQIDALEERAKTTNNVAQRKALYAALQQRLTTDLPILLLYQGRQINTFTTRLHNESGSLSSPFWDAGGWALDT